MCRLEQTNLLHLLLQLQFLGRLQVEPGDLGAGRHPHRSDGAALPRACFGLLLVGHVLQGSPLLQTVTLPSDGSPPRCQHFNQWRLKAAHRVKTNKPPAPAVMSRMRDTLSMTQDSHFRQRGKILAGRVKEAIFVKEHD